MAAVNLSFSFRTPSIVNHNLVLHILNHKHLKEWTVCYCLLWSIVFRHLVFLSYGLWNLCKRYHLWVSTLKSH